LPALAAMWPTPSARDYRTDYGDTEAGRKRMEHSRGKPLAHVAGRGGQLNPEWVEWLMGFPLGWTDLEPSATP
jgi:DNA (cytosine-5)-methyltransferase 1